MKKLTNKHTKIEAILFLENNLISVTELSKKAELTAEELTKIVKDLNAYYLANDHAFTILNENNNMLLVVKEELAVTLAHLYKPKNQQKLSRALLETLSIVAYSQPITKPEIDELRGVNSDGAIRLLLGQNLIKFLGKKQVPGSPNQYGTTDNFLKTFGLKSIKDLPKLKSHEVQKFDLPELKKKSDKPKTQITPEQPPEQPKE